MSIYLSLQLAPSCILTPFEVSQAINYYPLALNKGTELPQRTAGGTQVRVCRDCAQGLVTAWKPLKLHAILFHLVLGPYLSIQILFCQQINNKVLFAQYQHCLKWFVLQLCKAKQQLASQLGEAALQAELLAPNTWDLQHRPSSWKDKCIQTRASKHTLLLAKLCLMLSSTDI